jgi:hypothetical protein
MTEPRFSAPTPGRARRSSALQAARDLASEDDFGYVQSAMELVHLDPRTTP